MSGDKRYMTAKEAAAALDISLGTLYSYVSRGQLRSEPASGHSRARRYYAADVEVLMQRKDQRRNPAIAAQSALDFGSPVLSSAITFIEDGRLYYRGRNAIELAQTHRFEAVAALLWAGAEGWEARFSSYSESAAGLIEDVLMTIGPIIEARPGLTALERFQIGLPLAIHDDLTAYAYRPAGVEQSGVRLLALFAAMVTGQRSTAQLATQLQRYWMPARPDIVPLLDAALILCADHELNISAFTARCVVSAGAPLYGAVNAALAALQGTRHGGSSRMAETLLQEARNDPRDAVARRLRQGETLPGFGHRLYPDGDPRGRLLIEMAGALAPRTVALRTAQTVIRIVSDNVHLAPNLDFGLATLCSVLDLPAGASLVLFALGRTAGWIGHAAEEFGQARLIRPRATYTGPPPE